MQVQDFDANAKFDPFKSQKPEPLNRSVFKSSHPSLYLPKHQYCKYVMKSGRQKTGLNVIKEKPKLNQQFAIMNLMHQDVKRAQTKDDDIYASIPSVESSYPSQLSLKG